MTFSAPTCAPAAGTVPPLPRDPRGGGSWGVMQQGYKKLRMQPGKWRPTCSSSVPASPFTYICPATFPIKDYLGKTSPVTAACSSRSHYQVAVGGNPCPKLSPGSQGSEHALTGKGSLFTSPFPSPAPPARAQPPPSLRRGCPTPRCKQKPQHLQAAD